MFKLLSQSLSIFLLVFFGYIISVNCTNKYQEDPNKIKINYNLEVINKTSGDHLEGLFVHIFDKEPNQGEFSQFQYSDSKLPGRYRFTVFGKHQGSEKEFVAKASSMGTVKVQVKFFYTVCDAKKNVYYWPPQVIDTVLNVKALESMRETEKLIYKIDPNK